MKERVRLWKFYLCLKPKAAKKSKVYLSSAQEKKRMTKVRDFRRFKEISVTSVTLLIFPNFICHPPASSRKLISFLKITKKKTKY